MLNYDYFCAYGNCTSLSGPLQKAVCIDKEITQVPKGVFG